MNFKRTLKKFGDFSFDIADSVLYSLMGVLAAIGLVAISIVVYWCAQSAFTQFTGQKEQQELIATIQMTEIAEDGVISTARKYQAKGIEFNRDHTVTLKDVTDEFGHTFKAVRIQKNIPYIIERTK